MSIRSNRTGTALLVAGTLLLMALLAAYSLNPSHAWVDGMGFVPRDYHALLPHTVDAYSVLAVGRMIGACMVALLAGRWLAGRMPGIGAGLLLSAAVTVSVGVLWKGDGWTGTIGLGYENHRAAFLHLLLPFVCALALPSGGMRLFTRLTALVTGLTMSIVLFHMQSRAGIVLGCAGLMALFAWTVRPTRARRSANVALYACLAAAPMGLLIIFLQWGPDLAYRWNAIQDAFRLLSSRLFWGSGPGTFASVFPYYQQLADPDRDFSHLHCDPIELIVEFGVFGTAILALAIGLLLKGSAAWREEGLPPPAQRFAARVGLCALFAHSLVDFPFRSEPIVLAAGLLAGWAFSPLSDSADRLSARAHR